MDYTLEQSQDMMAENNGDLDLRGKNITSLPEGLIVNGDLDVTNTNLMSLPEGLVVKGSLYAHHTKITSLPNDLQVGRSIILNHTPLTTLPDNLVVNRVLNLKNTRLTSLPKNLMVRGSLDISNTSITTLPKCLVTKGSLFAHHTKITALPNDLQVARSIYLNHTPLTILPDNLVVDGDLDIKNTKLTSLPKGLMVRGYLDISNTSIPSLPEHLVVGSKINLRNTKICFLPKGFKANSIHANDNQLTNPNDYVRWQDGVEKENEYIFADDILTFIKRKRQVENYTFYQGRFPNRHVITDGVYFAHCKTLKQGIRDLAYKHAKNRRTEKYKRLTLNDTISVDDAIIMYRVITGACQAGVDDFVASLGKLKETYSVHEILLLTEGQYGYNTFKEFFSQTA